MTGKITTSARAIGAVVMAVILLVSVVGSTAALYDPATDGDVDPIANPAFPQQCGVNVLLVLDNSASLNQGNLTDVKNGANSTVDALSATDDVSGVGVISFNQLIGEADDGADTRIAITKLDSESDVENVKGAIGEIGLPDAETLTNWEAALLEASQSHNDQDGDVADENLNKPADIVILVSDGRPNAYGYPGLNGTGLNDSREAATLAANEVKSEGTRVIGVGFPDSAGNIPPAMPFEAITDGSGSITGSADFQENDYHLVDSSSDLSTVLTEIAQEIDCGLAVEKLNDANNDSTFSDDETAASPGDAVTYEVEVTNTGSIDLTIDSYVDDVYGTPVVSPALVGETLAAGSSLVVTFEGTAPPENGVKINTFNVTASDEDGFEQSDEDNTTVRSPDLTPSIAVEKLNDANNDSTFSDDETAASPGDAVTYQVTVTNDGPNNVTIDSFGDDIYGSPVVSPALVGETLAPGESITVTFEGTAPSTEDTAKVNTFNVSASDGDGDVATDEDNTTVRSPDLTPSIAVEKLVDADGNGTFADSEEAASPGDAVTYQVTVTNDGPNNVTIDSYVDDVYGTPVVSPALVGETLAPGASITVTFEGTAPAESNASKTNVFTVVASDADGDEATDSDDATVTTPPAQLICARTPGFWKTHNGEYAKGNNPDLTTELLPITLGDGTGESVVVDSDDTANAIFQAELTDDSHKSNGISKLYIHLLAAKLNTANGAAAPENVTETIERSDEILAQYNESDWDDIRKNDPELAQEIGELKDSLDRYNNGAFDDEDCIEDFWKEDR